MKYASTRGEAPVLGFSDALLAGLARDGGLYLPQEFPQFSAEEIRALRGKRYEEIAIRVLTPFIAGDIDQTDFERMVYEAYATFRHKAVCPLIQTDHNEFVLELFHGPTLASRTWRCSFSPG
jgi:threonine synthase